MVGRPRGRVVLLLRPVDGQFHPAGQLLAAPGADGALGAAVGGGRQDDGHVGVGVRFDDDLPAQVAGLVEPAGAGHLAVRDTEGIVVPQGHVAQIDLLTEAQLEGEGIVPVVGRGRGQEAGREGNGDRRHFDRRHAGQGLGVVPVVGEGHPDLDGLPLLAGRKQVAGAGGSVDVSTACGPLVFEGCVGQPVLVVYGRGVGRQGLVHLRSSADAGQARGRTISGIYGLLLRDTSGRGTLYLGRRRTVTRYVAGDDPDGVLHPAGEAGDGVGCAGYRGLGNVGRRVPAVCGLLPLHLVAGDVGTTVG